MKGIEQQQQQQQPRQQRQQQQQQEQEQEQEQQQQQPQPNNNQTTTKKQPKNTKKDMKPTVTKTHPIFLLGFPTQNHPPKKTGIPSFHKNSTDLTRLTCRAAVMEINKSFNGVARSAAKTKASSKTV